MWPLIEHQCGGPHWRMNPRVGKPVIVFVWAWGWDGLALQVVLQWKLASLKTGQARLPARCQPACGRSQRARNRRARTSAGEQAKHRQKSQRQALPPSPPTVAVGVPVGLLERRRHQQARRLRGALLVRPAAEEAFVRADVQRARQRVRGGHVEQRDPVRVFPSGDLDGHVLGGEGDQAVEGVVTAKGRVLFAVGFVRGCSFRVSPVHPIQRDSL